MFNEITAVTVDWLLLILLGSVACLRPLTTCDLIFYGCIRP